MLISEHESGNAFQLYEVRLPKGLRGPPVHYHMDFTETFTVKQGTLEFYLDANERRLPLSPGGQVTAQIGQLHRFANEHDQEVIFTVETRPPGGVVKAFQLAWGIANSGGSAPDGLPRNLLARLLFIRIAEGYAPGVPLILQRIVLSAAALLARLIGLEKKLAAYYD